MPLDFSIMPDEVPLADAPLLRVLCQVRYSSVPELVDDANERQLALKLERAYPVRGTAQGQALALPGLVPTNSVDLFRTFEDTAGDWKVTLAPDFVVLETSRYASRADFASRMQRVLKAVASVKTPPRVTRVGLRYIDRIEDPHGLRDLVNPSLLGILPHLQDEELLDNQIIQVLLRDTPSNTHVQVRSLCLPPNALFDPTIPGVSTRSWVLDIDSYQEGASPFDSAELTTIVTTLAERAYQVFYWAVTDAFRERFKAGTSTGEDARVNSDA